jgi:hypothetical protein
MRKIITIFLTLAASTLITLSIWNSVGRSCRYQSNPADPIGGTRYELEKN